MTPLRVALVYFISALMWIIFSDNLLHFLVERPDYLLRYQSLKGIAFVLLSSGLVYWLAVRLHKALSREMHSRKSHLNQLRRKAYTDDLTGLPNRRMGLRSLRRLLHLHQQKEVPVFFGLLFIDLDNFKHINDTLGHSIGDKVIVAAARRLESCLQFDEILIRHGGDEFIIILNQVNGRECLESYGKRILDMFNDPIVVDGMSLLVSASIGITRYPEDGTSSTILMRNADLALHFSKKYKPALRFYDETMSASFRYRFDLEQGLRKALIDSELQVYYQPFYAPGSGELVGAEALVRWPDKTGFVSPADFIPVAESTGQIRALGALVLKRACCDTRLLSEQLGKKLVIAVNVSPVQFASNDIIADLQEAINISGIDAAQVVLEITEGVFIGQIAGAARLLEEVVAMGVRLSMDDFGQGYSSLSYLRMHPFSFLKIDKLFIQGMVQSPQDYALVQASVAMAQALQLGIVAEGVETREQLEMLESLSVDYVQGFYLARPMAFDEYQKVANIKHV